MNVLFFRINNSTVFAAMITYPRRFVSPAPLSETIM